MNRLIVVSNRVAPINEGKSAAGGLAVAVLAAFKRVGGIWFGWSGEVVGSPQQETKTFQSGRLSYATVDLSQRDYEEYYNGFANSTLWPLFHYRLDLTEFSRRTFAGYLRVNGLFASRLSPILEPDDMVWVHDYHLIPFAEQLRQMGHEQPMGFFLHTPFPVPEILVSLPNHEAMVRSLCAYDVVGFQTESDRRAFVTYLVQEARAEVIDEKRVLAFGRVLHVDSFPISVDTAEIEKQAEVAGRSRQTAQLRESLSDRDLIIGVDRLDYSKGLPQRLEAFHQLLESYAENRNRVTFMQIAPPTRSEVQEYIDIRRELEAKAGHINGAFAEFDWVPIRYLNKSFSRRSLLGFYRISRIGLVTPLRDGMNLVAKEYVAAQDPDDPGVLVLSRFAGAAAEMESALIVNPYDTEGVAESLQRGLTMPLAERRERHQALMEILRHNDIDHWRDRFLEALSAAPFRPSGQA
ncbi:MAG: alpha,alpha-trehalose-phosphate synthase (UDP-forming) [Inquilinus sp.]|nr:alpha,alpha-trehalose-phosphate synthase (UDP-forming) [Inquilinus sp.]